MKIKIGFSQLSKPTPAKVIRICKAIKRLMATLSTVAFFESPKWMLVFLLMGWLTDEIQDWIGTPDGLPDGTKGVQDVIPGGSIN